MEMTDNMREYLRQRFYRNNHSKYRKYFEEWLNGVVDTQLMYFEKEKYSKIRADYVNKQLKALINSVLFL